MTKVNLKTLKGLFKEQKVGSYSHNVCLPAGSCQNTESATFEIGGESVVYAKCTDGCPKYQYEDCVDYCPSDTYLQEDGTTCGRSCETWKFRRAAAGDGH